MSRPIPARLVLGLILALLPAATFGADDLLSVLPQKTLAFVRLNRLAEVDAKVSDFAQRAQMPAPPLLALFKSRAGVAGGLNEKGSAAFVVLAAEDKHEEPPRVLFVPVTDYDKFLAPIKRGNPHGDISDVEIWDTPFVARKAGAYAVVAEPRFDEVLKNDLTPGGLDKELAPLAAFLSDSDAAAVATHRGIHTVAELIREQTDHMKEIFQGPQGANPQMEGAMRIFDIYSRGLQAIDEQTVALAAGLRVENEDVLRLSGRVRLVAEAGVSGGPAAQRDELLTVLPAGPYAVAFGSQIPKAVVKGLAALYGELLDLSVGFSPVDTEQLKRNMNESFALMQSTRWQSILLRPSEGEPLLKDVLTASRVEDAKRYLEVFERQHGAYPTPKGMPFGAAMTMTINSRRVKILGVSGLEVTMALPALVSGPIPNGEKLIGKDGKLTQYVVAPDKQTMVTGFATKDLVSAALAALKDPKKSLAADPLLAKTAQLLPKELIGVVYVNPRGTISFVNRVAKLFNADANAAQTLPEFPVTPPIGLALRTAPAEIQIEIVSPGEVARALMPYVMQAMAAAPQ